VAVAAAVLVIASPSLESGQENSPSRADGAGWSEDRLEALLESGTPVFVNVTADWCITCIANERGTLGTDAIRQAMTDRGMTYMVVDWTNYDANIAAFLARFGRNGVPLYLVYSGRAGEAPQVLPQLLTPGIVREAIDYTVAAQDLAQH
jgi:thiol:disulfide interchange protein